MKREALVCIILGIVILMCACGDRKSEALETDSPKSGTVSDNSTISLSPGESLTPVGDASEKTGLSAKMKEELLNASPDSLYEKCLAVADTTQRQQLENLKVEGARLAFGAGDEYIREIIGIMGLLPQNVARLTLADAKRIIQEMVADGYSEQITNADDSSAFKARFNEIAFAPDFDGGSGLSRVEYWFDDARTEYVEVCGATGVIYSHMVNGKWEWEYIYHLGETE
ncbi:MAG: hypothetical protein IJM57_04065 [Lachnospiraceae bacterium]|nr:hypothetical protein [Lachnospiraceae bacterium]